MEGSDPDLEHNQCRAKLLLRQILNCCNDAPRKDQREELAQLRQLPRRWLGELRSVIAHSTLHAGKVDAKLTSRQGRLN